MCTFTNPMIWGSSRVVDKATEETKNRGVDLEADNVFKFMGAKYAVDAADAADGSESKEREEIINNERLYCQPGDRKVSGSGALVQ